MKNKKLLKPLAGLSLFCLIYIIISLKPLGHELHLTPDWAVTIDRVQEKKDGDILIPFRLGQTIGYFTEDGRVIQATPYPHNATISSSYYTTYGADNKETDIFNTDGDKVGTITVPGFPFFDEDRIFMFLPGGTALAEFDESGTRKWNYEHYAPITAFDSTSKGSVVGFSDGLIVSFDSDGNLDQQYYPGGSEIEIILGAGISKNGKYIACICGQKQQRFAVSEKNGEHSKIIFHEYLPKDFSRQVAVAFNNASDTVYYNYNGGIGIVDLTTQKSAHIPVSGIVSQIEESTEEDLVFVLSHDGKAYTVTVIEPFNHVAGTFSFDADYTFMQLRGNKLFLGKNNKIFRITISKK
ncbi:MAG: hypothetical protein IJ828_07205 [Treponema sp.]|nr:hypothetical protein [Treponema sp.]